MTHTMLYNKKKKKKKKSLKRLGTAQGKELTWLETSACPCDRP